jgi:hypothetical protein
MCKLCDVNILCCKLNLIKNPKSGLLYCISMMMSLWSLAILFIKKIKLSIHFMTQWKTAKGLKVFLPVDLRVRAEDLEPLPSPGLNLESDLQALRRRFQKLENFGGRAQDRRGWGHSIHRIKPFSENISFIYCWKKFKDQTENDLDDWLGHVRFWVG